MMCIIKEYYNEMIVPYITELKNYFNEVVKLFY